MKNHVNNLKFFAKSIPTPDPPLFLKLLVDQLCQGLRSNIPVKLLPTISANTTPVSRHNPVHDQELLPFELPHPANFTAAFLAFDDHALFFHVSSTSELCV